MGSSFFVKTYLKSIHSFYARLNNLNYICRHNK